MTICRPRDRLRWLWLAGRVAQDLWDDESWEALCTQHVRLARQTGALAGLPIALRSRIFQHGLWGEVDEGAALTGEAEAVSAAIGTQLAAYGTVALVALQGREAETVELAEATLDDVESRGEGMGVGISHFTAGIALQRPRPLRQEALAEAERACEYEDLGVISWALTELIEAAVRCGRDEVAAVALERLALTAQAGDTDWGLGVHARSRALVSDGDAADALYREAIRRLRPHPRSRRACPLPPPLRRMAAPGAPPGGGARAATRCLRDAQRDGRGGVRGTCPPRAGRHRRDRAQTHR